jgi:hypothetical protein
MLQGFPGALGKQEEVLQRTNTTATTTTINPNATVGLYTTTPVQLVSSLAFDVVMIRVTAIAATANSGARGDLALDIMAGAGGSEYSICGPLLFGGLGAYSSYTLPIYIPSGTRISGRTAAGVASRTGRTFMFEYYGAPGRDSTGLPTRWIAYGTNISNGVGAYGTLITPGSTNAWGSWTALTTSTTYAHSLWMPMFGVGTGTTITALNYRSQFAIASTTGAATMVTNTTGVMDGPTLTGSTTEQLGSWFTATFPTRMGLEDIIYANRPSASAVSARSMCSGAPDTNAVSAAILAAVM